MVHVYNLRHLQRVTLVRFQFTVRRDMQQLAAKPVIRTQVEQPWILPELAGTCVVQELYVIHREHVLHALLSRQEI